MVGQVLVVGGLLGTVVVGRGATGMVGQGRQRATTEGKSPR